jgi:hypothetical protein
MGRLTRLFVWSFLCLAASCLSTDIGPPSPVSSQNRLQPFLPGPHPCGPLGQICCHAPASAPKTFGPLVQCSRGLGCDILSDKCVLPCGGAGQVCCDGPDTRALRWTSSGAVFSPTESGLREMCDQGACDVPTHRCVPCGTSAGAACCPPDASQATASCRGDEHLKCIFDPGTGTSGTCNECGGRGMPPCNGSCDPIPDLGIRNGLCDICGADSQPPCDRGCNFGLNVANGLCHPCGADGQIPCQGVCFHGLGVDHGLCTRCGGNEQIPCDGICQSPLKIQNGLCKLCGGEGNPPCDGLQCNGDLHITLFRPDPLRHLLICTANCGHSHQLACRTQYPVSGGHSSRYRCFDHSRLSASPGLPIAENCLCVPNTLNNTLNDVSDNSGFCISTFPAPGDIPDPPDCNNPDCSAP